MSGIRVRRHSDGLYAVSLRDEADAWIVMCHWAPTVGVSDAVTSGEGWVELLVTELPEPDLEDPDGEQVWYTAFDHIAAFEGRLGSSEYYHSAKALRADALKMLAAVAAIEQHRQKANRE